MDVEIKEQFEELGIEPSDDIITKSLELCVSYHVEDAVEFVEQWIAFSVSNLNGAEPTLDNLAEFERKVFQAKRDKELALANKKKMYTSAGKTSMLHYGNALEANPLAIYGVDDAGAIDDYDMGSGGGGGDSNFTGNVDDDAMLGSYNVCHTPKPKTKGGFTRTPARHNDALLFSPASYSPITGTPRTHTAGSGKIVYTFGNPMLISSAKWASTQPQQIHIKQLLLYNGVALSAAKSKYLFDSLHEKCEIAAERVFHIGKALCRKVFGVDADDYELSQVDMHSQNIIKTIGTICCDHDGPLDGSSTLLAGSDETRCRTVRLNFSKAKPVGVFPGQTVIVSGMNPRGDTFIVDGIHAERELCPPKPPKIAEPLSFVVAAGPYTHDDDLVYEPLHDLITYLKEHKPDVLILTGPFLDAEHTLISDNVTLAETFESFFEKMIAGIVESVGTSTTILIVTSHRDANADPVYPTMPITLKKTFPNLHVLSDPSMIDLNGIVIGMTSTDVVDHIVANELAINAGDKVKRVVSHLLNQGSFYPLHPPMENKMCYDSSLAAHFANIEQIPNVLILPSDQKCFIRVVNGCLAINPGRLADNNGGTFARFVITPPAAKDESNVFNYVACQVRRV